MLSRPLYSYLLFHLIAIQDIGVGIAVYIDYNLVNYFFLNCKLLVCPMNLSTCKDVPKERWL